MFDPSALQRTGCPWSIALTPKISWVEEASRKRGRLALPPGRHAHPEARRSWPHSKLLCLGEAPALRVSCVARRLQPPRLR